MNVGENRYLIEDEQVMKVWNTSNAQYEIVRILDDTTQTQVNLLSNQLTDELFLTYGMENLEISKTGLVNPKPIIYYFTTDNDVIAQPQNYHLKLTETVKSLLKIVIEKTGRVPEEAFSYVIITDLIIGTGDLQYAISKDKITWYSFDTVNSVWQKLSI